MNTFRKLAWDSAFFELEVAQIDALHPTLAEFERIYQALITERIDLCYWPAALDCAEQGVIAERFSGRLVDVKTTYMRSLDDLPPRALAAPESTRILTAAECSAKLLALAVQCGEHSRFRVDQRIPAGKFQALYSTWLEKSFGGEMGDVVWIAERAGQLAGFITLYCRGTVGYIGLVGVDSRFRGQGVGGALMRTALRYFKERDCGTSEVVTQGANQAACRLYEKFGYSVRSRVNFYHFWTR